MPRLAHRTFSAGDDQRPDMRLRRPVQKIARLLLAATFSARGAFLSSRRPVAAYFLRHSHHRVNICWHIKLGCMRADKEKYMALRILLFFERQPGGDRR